MALLSVARLSSLLSRPVDRPQVHDFTGVLWKGNYRIDGVAEGGKTIEMTAFSQAGVNRGDFIVLPQGGGAQTTRYQVQKVTRVVYADGDEPGLIKLELKFAPRVQSVVRRTGPGELPPLSRTAG